MKAKTVIFTILHWTWGLSQNIAGGIGFLLLRGKHKQGRFHGAFVTYINTQAAFGGVSLGKFIFVNAKRGDVWLHDTLIHEFGHCVQSILLGPLYWIVVALPSLIWCNVPPIVRWRKRNHVSYYRLYCEGWANRWGSAWLGEDFLTDEYKVS